jgi:hypothetical protein
VGKISAIGLTLVMGLRVSQAEPQTTRGVDDHTRATSKVEAKIVLVELDAWRRSGFDPPQVVVYTDGRIVYSEDHWGHELISRKLSPPALDAFVADLRLDDLRTLQPRYSCADMTDQPEQLLLIRESSSWRSILVNDGGARRCTPPAFQHACELLTSYHRNEARPWSPSSLQVLIIRNARAPGDPYPWPYWWPPSSAARCGRYLCPQLVTLPATQLEEVRSLETAIQGKRGSVPVAIKGERWSFLEWRWWLPDEESWQPFENYQ